MVAPIMEEWELYFQANINEVSSLKQKVNNSLPEEFRIKVETFEDYKKYSLSLYIQKK